MVEILSSEKHSSMLDELMNTGTSEVRKAKIVHELLNNNDNVHKTIEEKDSSFNQLREESKTLVDVNRKMMSDMYSGNGTQRTFGKEKSLSETISIEQMERKYR